MAQISKSKSSEFDRIPSWIWTLVWAVGLAGIVYLSYLIYVRIRLEL